MSRRNWWPTWTATIARWRMPGAGALQGIRWAAMAPRIGMKYPEIFSSVYLLSPCCMAANLQQGGRGGSRAEAVRTEEDFAKADFGTKAQIASAAAWSPNPKNPPLFFDLQTKDGEYQPRIAAKWAANAPLAMIDQYVTNIRKLKAFAFDAGAQDQGIAATVRTLDQIMTDYGIAHEFEIYEGTHTSHVADRIETRTLPFFSKHLKAAVH
jgi:S-formylglutathione hydrolase